MKIELPEDKVYEMINESVKDVIDEYMCISDLREIIRSEMKELVKDIERKIFADSERAEREAFKAMRESGGCFSFSGGDLEGKGGE